MLTHKQRQRVNRENAAKSTGPKSDEGKAISRRNALKHGLRAETLVLPHEDPAELKDLHDWWTEFYGPDTPAEVILIERAVFYAMLTRRSARYQSALVSEQVRHALLNFDATRQAEFDRFHELLESDDPNAGYQGMRGTVLGCQWLLRYWVMLGEKLRDGQNWNFNECDLASRLTGIHPNRQGIGDSGIGVVLGDHEAMLNRQAVETEATAPLWSEFRRAMLEAVTEEEAELRGLVGPERLAIEAADRAEAVCRALVPSGPEGALALRYEKMIDSGFHRANREINKAVKEAEKREEAAENGDEAGALNSEEPNEAKRWRVERPKCAEEETCGESSGEEMTSVEGSTPADAVVSVRGESLARVPGGSVRVEKG